VTGDGLLPGRDETRRSIGGTVVFLASLGVEVLGRLDTNAEDVAVRPDRRSVGDGVSESLSRRCADVTDIALAPLPSSHGSFFRVADAADFFCIRLDVILGRERERGEALSGAAIWCSSREPDLDERVG
jgi:hypothetical protein